MVQARKTYPYEQCVVSLGWSISPVVVCEEVTVSSELKADDWGLGRQNRYGSERLRRVFDRNSISRRYAGRSPLYQVR